METIFVNSQWSDLPIQHLINRTEVKLFWSGLDGLVDIIMGKLWKLIRKSMVFLLSLLVDFRALDQI